MHYIVQHREQQNTNGNKEALIKKIEATVILQTNLGHEPSIKVQFFPKHMLFTQPIYSR